MPVTILCAARVWERSRFQAEPHGKITGGDSRRFFPECVRVHVARESRKHCVFNAPRARLLLLFPAHTVEEIVI